MRHALALLFALVLIPATGAAQSSPPVEPVTPVMPFPRRTEAVVLFASSSARVDYAYNPLLADVARALKGGLKGSVITLVGFTDSEGPEGENQELSEQRANAVRDILIERFNVPAQQLRVVGYGEHFPAMSNDTAQGRRYNRRVEFRREQAPGHTPGQAPSPWKGFDSP